jgi:hypothetical protein
VEEQWDGSLNIQVEHPNALSWYSDSTLMS